jgi:hypothetical protein
MVKMSMLEPVRDEIDEVSGRISQTGQKLMRAGEFLLKGFTREQVCERLKLTPDVVERMQIALEPNLSNVRQEVPIEETWDEFRARKKGEIGKKILGIVERHVDAQDDVAGLSGGLMDKDEMATVRDASVIAHKWLNEEKDAQSGPRVAISFSALAQVSPIDQAKPVFELPAESAPEAPSAGAESPGDDWLG